MPVEHQDYPQDEEKSIGLVRDDGIRKDGVGMPAGTDDAGYAYTMLFVPRSIEINDMPVVVSMNPAVTLPLAAGTGLLFWMKRFHTSVEIRSRREFITN